MRVLVVEDSNRLRDTIRKALQRSGFAVDDAADGKEGWRHAHLYSYDAIVLDIMLPGLDGLQILERLRHKGDRTPVLFLTAKAAVEDRVKGLQSGADDYLVKPFALDEFLARVQALCRRRYDQAAATIRVADLEVDTAARRVTRGGCEIALAGREYNLLHLLALRTGEIVSRRDIEEHIYDEMNSPLSNAVDAAVYALRRKLATTPDAPDLIHTRRGLGYVLEAPGA